jgi:hypothetical protein
MTLNNSNISNQVEYDSIDPLDEQLNFVPVLLYHFLSVQTFALYKIALK